MKYEIKGGNLPVVICTLQPGETMVTESGAMSWMSPNMKMETGAKGGLGGAFGRMFSGESIFQNRYTAQKDEGLIAFASSFPGEIRAVDIAPGRSIVVQKRGFLACTEGVELSVFFQKKFGTGFFGGEGFIMQKLSGSGTAFLEIDGSTVEYDLERGQSMIVDTGYLAAMDDTCTMEIVSVPGVKNKLFGGEGYKLPDEVEEEIEHHVFNNGAELTLCTGTAIGTVRRVDTALSDYVDYLAKAIGADLTGLNIAIDCANGAASEAAGLLFPRLGAACRFIGTDPDGGNINEGCGSTHLDKLAKYVVDNGLDCGVAFDGDADRCLAVDEKGREIDGDKIIAILAKDLKDAGKLPEDTAVVTVMSNLGFIEYMKQNGMKTAVTAVGDRYVLEEMRDKGYVIGGEQSGHIILLAHSTTGDGELTAGMLLRTMAEKKCRMSELNDVYVRFPQVMVNIKATPEEKARYKEDEYIAGFIESQQQSLMGLGRVLVRVSGTEPLIRIMVEGRDEAAIAASAERIAVKINERIH